MELRAKLEFTLQVNGLSSTYKRAEPSRAEPNLTSIVNEPNLYITSSLELDSNIAYCQQCTFHGKTHIHFSVVPQKLEYSLFGLVHGFLMRTQMHWKGILILFVGWLKLWAHKRGRPVF